MGKKAGKRSGAAKKKAATRKASNGPVNRKEVREHIAEMVADGADKMTNAMIEEAGKGLLPQYKFLLEVSGVYPASGAEESAAEDSDALAKVLLERLHLPNSLESAEGESAAGESKTAAEVEETVSVE
jgi:hypothetical protein